MTALVAVSLGNTTAAAVLVGPDGRLGTVRRAPISDLAGLVAACRTAPAEAAGAAGARGGPMVVASVNPPALARLEAAAEAAGLAPPQVAGRDFPIPVATAVEEPERVGTDRLLAALAAYRRTGGACIVVDAGTAVTVDAVDERGVFLGGAILPGLGLMARALAEGTAQVPMVEPPGPGEPLGPAIGRNTRAAVRAGLVRGWPAAVGAVVEAVRTELGAGPVPVVVTGGDALRLSPEALGAPAAVPADGSAGPAVVRVPDLVLEGLVLAWRAHHKA